MVHFSSWFISANVPLRSMLHSNPVQLLSCIPRQPLSPVHGPLQSTVQSPLVHSRLPIQVHFSPRFIPAHDPLQSNSVHFSQSCSTPVHISVNGLLHSTVHSSSWFHSSPWSTLEYYSLEFMVPPVHGPLLFTFLLSSWSKPVHWSTPIHFHG